MKRAWLYYFPLLFLPNLGFGVVTEFGVLELADLLIVPFILLVCLAPRGKRPTVLSKSFPLMLVFVVWALATDLLINIRYGYTDKHYMVFGLLKLAKLVLYGVAGILTSKALVDEPTRRYFTRSLIVAGLIIGLGLSVVGQKSAQPYRPKFAGYKTSNEVSVSAAILVCCVAGLRLRGAGLGRWDRRLALAALLLMAAGLGISEGRGGWVAGIAGILYLSHHILPRRKAVALILGVFVFVFGLYTYSTVFRQRVNLTVSPELAGLEPE